MLASNAERDGAARRLQDAFAEHRLTDDEFDSRIKAALTARTTADLGKLTADLPVAAPAVPVAGGSARKPGRFAVALKSSIARAGRWTVPARFFSVVYKGSGLIDLQAAELTAAVTTITALSYKSRTQILLPPGVRLELGGTGVSAVGAADEVPAPPRTPQSCG
jgi:hypothetical protein